MALGKKESHESYGMIGCSRATSGKGHPLFGSSVLHSNSIILRIKRAVVERHLNRDWYYGKEPLIEVELSPTQFAEMITSLNVGDGIPCTIRYTENKVRMEDPPEVKQRLVFENEFKEDINHLKELYEDKLHDVRKLLRKKGNLLKPEKAEIDNFLFELTRIIEDYMPFLQKSFNEAMDKTVMEAKGEVEAFVMSKVTSLGIEGLEKEMLKLTEGD